MYIGLYQPKTGQNRLDEYNKNMLRRSNALGARVYSLSIDDLTEPLYFNKNLSIEFLQRFLSTEDYIES